MDTEAIRALLANEMSSGISITTTAVSDGSVAITITSDFPIVKNADKSTVLADLKRHLIKVQNVLHSIVSGM